MRRFGDATRFCSADGTALLVVDPRVGSLLWNDLELGEPLGRGQGGTVYRGWQRSLQRPVAVKILHSSLLSDVAMRRRFDREARAVARLAHPSVVALHAVGATSDGAPCLVMELAAGQTLEAALASGPLPVETACAIAEQVAEALAHAHAAGVVHRDLKPANIMLVTEPGGVLRVKVLDFGVARLADGARTLVEGALTAAGAVLGTPHYVAPEQARGETVGPAADLYSLGVVLYRMVTGCVPFDGPGVAVMLAHLHQAPPAPSSLRPLPEPLEHLILRCLAKSAADRFASAADLAAALAQARALPSRVHGNRLHDAPGVAARTPSSSAALAFETSAPSREAGGGLRWLAALAIAMLLLVAVGAAGQRLSEGAAASASAPPTAELGARRTVVLSEQGYALQASLPEQLHAGDEQTFTFELWEPSGAPLRAPELILAVEEPSGASRGVAARSEGVGRYRMTARFAHAGHYRVRLFPPRGDAVLRLFFEVDDRAPPRR